MSTKNIYLMTYTVIIVFMTLFICLFVSKEQDIYSFDYTLYWGKWERFSQNIFSHPLYDIGKVFSSLWKRDYNFLPVIFPSCFYFLPIPSRLSYILSIFSFYFLPSIFLFSHIVKKICNNKNDYTYIIPCLLFSTSAPFIAPTLRGYPDIGGALFIMCSVSYFMDTNFTVKQPIRRIAIMSSLLWLSFAFRRWYLYTDVSIYISSFIISLFYIKRNHLYRSIKNIFENFAKSFAIFIGLFCIFQGKILYTILTYKYSQAYSAYQFGNIYSIIYTIHHIGYFIILSSILGFILSLFSRNKKYKIFSLFCLLNMVVSFSLFTRTQSPGIQHIIPFALWIIFLACFAHIQIITFFKKRYIKISYLTSLAILLVFTLYSSFFDVKSSQYDYLFPEKSLPLHVENYSSYLNLAHDVEHLLSSEDKLLVLSSSYTVLNDTMVDHLTHYHMSHHILLTYHVDLRDGINPNIMKAHYILVVDPIQTHLPSSGQRDITIPAHDMLNHTTIGKAFEKTRSHYLLNSGAVAYLYEKKRPISYEEITNFLDEFYIYYPQWRSLYTPEWLAKEQTSP